VPAEILTEPSVSMTGISYLNDLEVRQHFACRRLSSFIFFYRAYGILPYFKCTSENIGQKNRFLSLFFYLERYFIKKFAQGHHHIAPLRFPLLHSRIQNYVFRAAIQGRCPNAPEIKAR